MITVDLHTHTKYSHGANTPAEMYASALDKGLTLLGFSEHSPRPQGFDYQHEYRERLSRHLPDYAREVLALKAAPREGAHGPCRVLFGMEMDWLDGQEDFTRTACKAYDFDYLLGSVHFLGRWGFDDGVEPWKSASQEECESRYTAYFTAWEAMLRSGLFNIAAHPDLIKIFSVEQFHIWLAKPESLAHIRRCLTALRDAGMAMEISSAGLRKTCREIYPAPPSLCRGCRHARLSGYLCVEIRLLFRSSTKRVHFLHKRLFLLDITRKFILWRHLLDCSSVTCSNRNTDTSHVPIPVQTFSVRCRHKAPGYPSGHGERRQPVSARRLPPGNGSAPYQLAGGARPPLRPAGSQRFG